eukprot:jgi/Botrbrau1/5434/Bobra.182_1s0036.1
MPRPFSFWMTSSTTSQGARIFPTFVEEGKAMAAEQHHGWRWKRAVRRLSYSVVAFTCPPRPAASAADALQHPFLQRLLPRNRTVAIEFRPGRMRHIKLSTRHAHTLTRVCLLCVRSLTALVHLLRLRQPEYSYEWFALDGCGKSYCTCSSIMPPGGGGVSPPSRHAVAAIPSIQA